MTDPDRMVISSLARPGRHDLSGLALRTRLSRPTLAHTVTKLRRMGWIAGDDDGYRLTGAGRHAAMSLRDAP